MSFVLLTDSTADLDGQWAKANKVDLLGLTIECDGITYETVGPNALDSDTLLAKMMAGSKPKTSQINVGTFEEYFRQKVKAGQAVLYIAFSSILSGTYQSAVMARQMVLDDYPEAVIEIVDTLAAAGGEGYLVMLAVEARDQGQSLEAVKLLIEDTAPRLRTYFLVDDLYHLMRGGRLSKSSAILGSIASIKPILWIDAQGKLVPISKARGRKKALRDMEERIASDIDASRVVIAHSVDPEGAEQLKASLLANPKISDVLVMPLGPVIAAHVGPKTLAAFVIGHKER